MIHTDIYTLHSLLSLVEDGAAVHVLTVRLRHGPGTRFGAEEALIAMFLQLHQEEVVVLLCLHFLPRKQTGRLLLQT